MAFAPAIRANGDAYTGSGAGGIDGNATAGSGGKGIVILRIRTADYSSTSSGNETPITDGAYTVLKFHGNGSYTG